MSSDVVLDARFTHAVYTRAQAARHVGLDPDDLRRTAMWTVARARVGNQIGTARNNPPPIVTSLRRPSPPEPRIPFIGLAEAVVYAAVRQGTALPPILAHGALTTVRKSLGGAHPLATRAFVTDALAVLRTYAQHEDAAPEIVRAVTAPAPSTPPTPSSPPTPSIPPTPSTPPTAPNPPTAPASPSARDLPASPAALPADGSEFALLVARVAAHVDYGEDGYIRRIRLPGHATADVIVDSGISGGRPFFARGGPAADVETIVRQYQGGVPIGELADRHGVPSAEIAELADLTWPDPETPSIAPPPDDHPR
ncbi:hypothetical protein [Frankia sp. AvcI1]|uniref:hypothetical protein n=1 Tax=Frankia sp. AvcI1 TaxID=573496 RepID=UPI002118CF60|nr:hypothetical protein [Frankia sp. AvcI1]